MNATVSRAASRRWAAALVSAALLAFVAYPAFTEDTAISPTFATIAPPSHIVVLFGGDMLFDRTVRAVMEEKGDDFIFSCITDTLTSADIVVANLEGPITEHTSVSMGSEIGSPENFQFTFPTTTASLLARHNIRLVNLGNNHVLNFGWEGARSTIGYLRAADVGYFGLPAPARALRAGGRAGDPKENTVARVEKGGVRLAFVNYNEFAPEGWRASAESALARIQKAKADDYLPIVYAHWGDEYLPKAPPRVREAAHAFVDAGAILVVGSHPHVVQEHEQYQEKYIYYSLGNFIFDQHWSEAVRHGLLLEVEISKNGVTRVEEVPIDTRSDRRTCVL